MCIYIHIYAHAYTLVHAQTLITLTGGRDENGILMFLRGVLKKALAGLV